MDATEFRAFLDLLMCSDPYPCEGEEDVKHAANRMARERGYDGWLDAYHQHVG